MLNFWEKVSESSSYTLLTVRQYPKAINDTGEEERNQNRVQLHASLVRVLRRQAQVCFIYQLAFGL